MKQGILIVNHGTMDTESRSRTLDDFMLSIGDRIEDADISIAYTDSEVRRKVREVGGEKVQNLKAAILGMKERGVTHLIVVSTNIHDCDEYRKMKEETAGLAGLFSEVNISKPLLSSQADIEITARAIHGAFGEMVGDDILILVVCGGKTDGADELEKLEETLQRHFAHAYIAALHGEKKLYKALKSIKQKESHPGRIVLVPFEFIAGDMVENEVSQEYTEHAQRLEEEGFEVEKPFIGIAEYDDLQRLYMRHLYDSNR